MCLGLQEQRGDFGALREFGDGCCVLFLQPVQRGRCVVFGSRGLDERRLQ
jgi:hypothetical protein